MSELFLKIVNMSLSASWLILAVIVFRFTFKKAPKWVNVLMWGIVAVRLICPISIESVMSLIPRAEVIPPNIMIETPPTIDSDIPIMNDSVNNIVSDSNTVVIGDSVNSLQQTFIVLSTIWIIGVGLLALYTLISYWRLYRQVRSSICFQDNIFQSEHVGSPFVLGIIQPKIYLPFEMEKENLGYVIAHEQAHIHRKDHWWKPFGFLLLTVYWFNPLMWIAYVLLCKDIELACDEKVIKLLGNEQKADYSQALLSYSISKRMITACPIAFGEVGVKERVKFVLNYKKPTFWVIILSVIICTIIGICFLTNPKDSIPVMKSDVIEDETFTVFGTDISRTKIENITFYDTLENAPEEAIDISEKQNGSVLMWTVKDGDYYDMYIAGDGGVKAPEDSSYLFAQYKRLRSIDLGNCFDTSEVTNMRSMFENCRVSSIDVSGFDTSNVTDMSSMFANCKRLETIDISGFDMSNVVSVSKMFADCTSFTSIKANDRNAPSLTEANSMFENCNLLTNVELNNWHVENVTSTSSMFLNCIALVDVKMNGWTTSRLTNMSQMFSECVALTNVEMSDWDTSSVTDMSYLFSECVALTNIDVANWNTSQVTNMKSMFKRCSSLVNIDVSKWDTSKVTDMTSMFERCTSLPIKPEITIPDKTKTTLMFYELDWNKEPLKYHVEKMEVVTDDGVTESDTWVVGKGISMKFTVNSNLSKFKYVEVDGKVIYIPYYTTENDGATINILANYLDDYIRSEEHKLRVQYEDGAAEVTFRIELEKLPPMEGYYEYPVVPGDAEWIELTLGEKMQVCKIPENVLDSMTDEQLIQATLDYPFLGDVHVYNSIVTGARSVAKKCDAFSALLQRESAKESCIAYLEEHFLGEPPEEVDDVAYDKHCFLMLVRYNGQITDQYTSEDMEIIKEASVNYSFGFWYP